MNTVYTKVNHDEENWVMGEKSQQRENEWPCESIETILENMFLILRFRNFQARAVAK